MNERTRPKWQQDPAPKSTTPSDNRAKIKTETDTTAPITMNTALAWFEPKTLVGRTWLLRLLYSTLDQTTLKKFDSHITIDLPELHNKPTLNKQAACQLLATVNQLDSQPTKILLTNTNILSVDFSDLKKNPDKDHATGLKNEEVYQRLLRFLRFFIQQTEMHNGQNTVGQPVLRPQTQAELDQVKQHLIKLGFEENWIEFVECNQTCSHPLEALANCLMQLGSLFADLICSETALEQQQREEYLRQLDQTPHPTPSPSPSSSSKKRSKKDKSRGKKRGS